MELVDVSSSEIRSGQKWYALHPGVRRYIAQHHLYLESFVEGRLSAKRYAHSVRVAQLEQHVQRVYAPEWIAEQLTACGLVFDVKTDFVKEGVVPGEKQFYICRRKQR